MTHEELNQILDKATSEYQTSDYETSEQHCIEVLNNLTNKNDAEDIGIRARTVTILGTVSRLTGNYSLALEQFTKSLEYFEEIADELGIANAINNIGIVFWLLSDYPSALEYFGKALNQAEKINHLLLRAKLVANIGMVYHQLSDFQRAIEYYSKALSYHEQLDDKAGVATCNGNLGSVYGLLSDYTRALEYFGKALRLNEQLGNKAQLTSNNVNIGNVYCKLSDYSRALEYFLKSLALDEQLGNKAGVAADMGNIGTVYADEKFDGFDVAKAQEYLLKSIEMFEELGEKRYLYGFHKTLADLYEKQERWKEFALHYKRYHELKEEVQSEETKMKAERLDFELKQAEREKEIARQKFEMEILAKEHEIERLKNVELAQANEDLTKLNAEKSEFLGIAAHDLKNPLAAITTSIGILKRYGSRLTAEEVLEKHTDIERTSKRMLDIITNLLDINAIERGAISLKSELFNLSETVQEVVNSNRQRAEEKSISIFFDLVPEPAEITADRQITSQVIDNLVSNAVKYSPQNKNVWVNVEPSEKSVKISVQDEGPGISEEDMEKLFGRFQRLSAKPTGGEHSTGLGLSIVKKLVEAMNGKVWCESELGKGATFFVELPKE